MSIITDKHKADAGKAPISLVPTAIIWDIAAAREYGLRKYPETGRDGWRTIGKDRIRAVRMKSQGCRIWPTLRQTSPSCVRWNVMMNEILSMR